eukprot:858018-Rhodomonas_salina.2
MAVLDPAAVPRKQPPDHVPKAGRECPAPQLPREAGSCTSGLYHFTASKTFCLELVAVRCRRRTFDVGCVHVAPPGVCCC